jgi:hypothetical protein
MILLRKFSLSQLMKKLANLKLSIIILFLIGIAISLGTVIEQNQSLSFYKENYPVNINSTLLNWETIIFFDLCNLYTTSWFLSLLAFFGLTLLSCTQTLHSWWLSVIVSNLDSFGKSLVGHNDSSHWEHNWHTKSVQHSQESDVEAIGILEMDGHVLAKVNTFVSLKGSLSSCEWISFAFHVNLILKLKGKVDMKCKGDPFTTGKRTLQAYKGVYLGKDMPIHFKYSDCLNITFLAMLYGLGMPIMFPMAAIIVTN